MSDSIKTDLPLGITQLHDDLQRNFEIIAKYFEGKAPEEIDQTIKEIFDKYNDEIHREIRAIIMPEMDPLEVTDQVQDFKTDSEGIKHETISDRLTAELRYFQDKYFRDNDILHHQFDITDAGIISIDFIEASSLMKAKKIGIIGDSVAHGWKAAYNFGDIFHKKTGATIENLAINGAKMANIGSSSIFKQAQVLKNCDVVIIQGTDDDWLGNVPIGNLNDATDQTYLGALYQIVQTIKRNNPKAKLLAMTATLQAPTTSGVIGRTDDWKNSLGLDLHDYMDAEKKALSQMMIPYADFMVKGGVMDPINPAFRKAMMSEGLHPNEVGHQWIAQELAKNFYYFYG
ncbi:SGNH/GDSL hydrolase family protein [Enterococcus faecium]